MYILLFSHYVFAVVYNPAIAAISNKPFYYYYYYYYNYYYYHCKTETETVSRMDHSVVTQLLWLQQLNGPFD